MLSTIWVFLVAIPLTLVNGISIWLDPLCPSQIAISFNEARYIATLLHQTLSLDYASYSYLDDPFKWFFAFSAKDTRYIDKFRGTVKKIADLTRTFKWEESNARIYCRNEILWEPQPVGGDDEELEEEATWRSADKFWMNMPFRHMIEEDPADDIRFFGRHLYCRQSDRKTRAATFQSYWDESKKAHVPIDEPFVDVCDLLLKVPYTTSQDACVKDLAKEVNEVPELVPMAFTILHELIHFYFISMGMVDGKLNMMAEDYHEMKDGTRKSGYYMLTKKDKQGNRLPNPLPGDSLKEPKYTLFNPDSYEFFFMYFRFRMKGWEMYLSEDKRLKYRWIREDATRWSGEEWERNSKPNWFDGATPMEYNF